MSFEAQGYCFVISGLPIQIPKLPAAIETFKKPMLPRPPSVIGFTSAEPITGID